MLLGCDATGNAADGERALHIVATCRTGRCSVTMMRNEAYSQRWEYSRCTLVGLGSSLRRLRICEMWVFNMKESPAVAPGMLHEAGGGDHATGIEHERVDQTELGWGQAHLDGASLRW